MKSVRPLKICIDRIIPDAMAIERHVSYRTMKCDVLRELNASTSRSALMDINPDAPGIIGRPRMALINARKWENGQELRCRFLQGSKKQKAGVIRHAEVFEQYANLKFKFIDSGDAEIRIAFVSGEGSWSAVGTDALVANYFPKHQPTMNYGWLRDDTSNQEYRSVVLHEFGHAIGCIHEHQSPNVELPWNKEAVYRAFSGAPNFWTREEIDHNILRKYSRSGTSATIFDPDSIMLYQFDEALFTHGKATPNNTKLSALDVQMIGEMYPFPERTVATHRRVADTVQTASPSHSIVVSYFWNQAPPPIQDKIGGGQIADPIWAAKVLKLRMDQTVLAFDGPVTASNRERRLRSKCRNLMAKCEAGGGTATGAGAALLEKLYGVFKEPAKSASEVLAVIEVSYTFS